jgi:hypothetical protein
MLEVAPHQYRCEQDNETVTITFNLDGTSLMPVISFVPSGRPLEVINNVATLNDITELNVLQIVYQFNGLANGVITTTAAGSEGGRFDDVVVQPFRRGQTIRALYTFAPKTV